MIMRPSSIAINVKLPEGIILVSILGGLSLTYMAHQALESELGFQGTSTEHVGFAGEIPNLDQFELVQR